MAQSRTNLRPSRAPARQRNLLLPGVILNQPTRCALTALSEELEGATRSMAMRRFGRARSGHRCQPRQQALCIFGEYSLELRFAELHLLNGLRLIRGCSIRKVGTKHHVAG